MDEEELEEEVDVVGVLDVDSLLLLTAADNEVLLDAEVADAVVAVDCCVELFLTTSFQPSSPLLGAVALSDLLLAVDPWLVDIMASDIILVSRSSAFLEAENINDLRFPPTIVVSDLLFDCCCGVIC